MENYNLSDLYLDPSDGYVAEFRKAAAQIAATIDMDPLTGLPRGQGQPGLASLAPSSMNPMMPMEEMNGQSIIDPAMMPPQMIQPNQIQPNIQDPQGGMQQDLQNNPMGNSLGV